MLTKQIIERITIENAAIYPKLLLLQPNKLGLKLKCFGFRR